MKKFFPKRHIIKTDMGTAEFTIKFLWFVTFWVLIGYPWFVVVYSILQVFTAQ